MDGSLATLHDPRRPPPVEAAPARASNCPIAAAVNPPSPRRAPSTSPTIRPPRRTALPRPGADHRHDHQAQQPRRVDADLYRFTARAGEQWVFEVNAARSASKLDSFLEVLDEQGNRIPRVLLQAVRDSYFTFRGKDDTEAGDFRVFNWQEMRLNEYLYSNGEVVKLWLYPRGPDSGFVSLSRPGNALGLLRYHAAGARPGRAVLRRRAPPAGGEAGSQRPAGLPALLRERRRQPSRARQGLAALLHRPGRRRLPGQDQGRARAAGARLQIHHSRSAPATPISRSPFTAPTSTVDAGSAREFKVTAQRLDDFDGPIRVDIERPAAGLLGHHAA